MTTTNSPFVEILAGNEPGNIIARDDERQFAIIDSLYPEAAVHWIAIPFEMISSIEELESQNPARFAGLVQYAVTETKRLAEDHPILQKGFTIKFHFGSFETVPHAKLHILSTE